MCQNHLKCQLQNPSGYTVWKQEGADQDRQPVVLLGPIAIYDLRLGAGN